MLECRGSHGTSKIWVHQIFIWQFYSAIQYLCVNFITSRIKYSFRKIKRKPSKKHDIYNLGSKTQTVLMFGLDFYL